jgi:hypothetical protein
MWYLRLLLLLALGRPLLTPDVRPQAAQPTHALLQVVAL